MIGQWSMTRVGRSAVHLRANFSMNKVIRQLQLFGETFSVVAEERYRDVHAQPIGQVRPSYLRYMAVCTHDYGVQIILDYNVERGTSFSVRIRSDKHSYG